MSQKLPVNGFKWIEDTSKINEKFIKNYDENNDKGYILEVDVNILKNCTIYIVIYHSYQKEWKLINVIYVIKKICCAYKTIKTSIKSWIKIKKDSQNY